MTRLNNFPRAFLLVGIPALILGVLILISHTSLNNHSDALSLGITIDLLFTLPLAYFFLVRKKKVPTITVLPILILSVVLGSLILPKEDQTYLDWFKLWGLPIIELGVVSYLIYKVNRAVHRFKALKNPRADFYTTLVETCREMFPSKLVYPLSIEIAVIYYGFIKWRKAPLRQNEFTYHKESGTVALLIALLFMISVETFVIHLLLDQWSSIAAWVLSLLSIYSGLQIFGFMKSMLHRPILISEGKVYFRYGVMSETIIPIEQIEKIELSTKDLEEGVTKLSLLGNLESHNLVIHLNAEHTLLRLYGIRKTYQKLALHVDEPLQFVERINEIQSAP